MAVKIDSISFTNELRTETVDWLLANVGDKITIEIELSSSEYVIASTDNTIIINNIDGYIGGNWVTDSAGRFANFKVGDSVKHYNYVAFIDYGTFTIVDKLSDSEIQLSGVGVAGTNIVGTDNVFSIVNPITAVKYKWNFIENDDQPTFISKIDGSEQLLVAKVVDASDTVTVVPMVFIGSPSYQIGEAEIIGDGITLTPIYKNSFKITHQTFITPFILATQLENLETNTAPDYFFNLKCLKGIFDIECAYFFTDPNYLQTVEITETKGNSGWYGENFNTGLTNYYIDSVVYKKVDNTIIPSAQLTDITDTIVEIVIKNTVDTPFSNNNTKFTINFCKVPFAETDYQANGKTVTENFVFDRALQTVGSASVNGDNFGGDSQALKTITALFVSSSEIKITARVSLSTLALGVINDSEEHRYMIFVAIQNHTLATTVSDKVTLLADQQLFYEDATDDGMIVNTITMLRHWENDCDTQGTSPKAGVAPVPEVKAIAKLPSGYYSGLTGTFTITITSVPFGVLVFTSSLAPYLNAVIDVANQINAHASGFKVTNSGAQGIIAPAGYGSDPNNVWDVEWSGSYLISTPNPNTAFFKGGVDEVAGVAGETIDVFPEDEVVFCNNFYIDKNGREFDSIVLKRITTNVKVVYQNTQEEFTLDSFSTDLSNLPFISGNQFVDLTLDKVYHIPSAEPRKAIRLMRRIDLDLAGKYYYELEVPYLIRWEYWKALALADGDFFDVGEPNNGWNQFWHRYNTVTDWKLTYETEIKATKNGASMTFKSQALVGSNDYDTNADWNPNTIKSYKDSDNTYLFDGSKNYILGYEGTRIEAEFTKVSGTPVLSQIKMVIGIEVFEEGGIEGRRRLSSVWETATDTWLLSTDTSNKVVLSLSGNTVKGVCLVDFNEIPLDKKRFKLTARLYEVIPDTASKNFQDGGDFVYQDGDNYVFQDQ